MKKNEEEEKIVRAHSWLEIRTEKMVNSNKFCKMALAALKNKVKFQLGKNPDMSA